MYFKMLPNSVRLKIKGSSPKYRYQQKKKHRDDDESNLELYHVQVTGQKTVLQNASIGNIDSLAFVGNNDNSPP